MVNDFVSMYRYLLCQMILTVFCLVVKTEQFGGSTFVPSHTVTKSSVRRYVVYFLVVLATVKINYH